MHIRCLIVVTCFFLATSTLSYAQDGSEGTPQPYYGIGKKDYVGISGYWVQSKMPSGEWVSSGGPELLYLRVDYGLAHIVTVDFGFSHPNGFNNLTGGYGFALGPRSGYLHAGVLLEAGYSRFFDSADNGGTVHAANLKVSGIVLWTFWKRLQFFLKVGNSIQIFSTGQFEDPVAWRGFMLGSGLMFNFDPFPLPTAD